MWFGCCGQFFWVPRILFLVVISVTRSQAERCKCLEDAFRKCRLVPDVIDEAPRNILKLSFHGHSCVELGNVLTPTQTFNPPIYVSYPFAEQVFYTLIMTDPDANEEEREFKHWLLMNIPGSRLDMADVMTAYVGSGPPLGHGLHRYLFLIYCQPGYLNVESEPRQDNRTAVGRTSFNTRLFVQKWGLINPPWAGNFYRAEYDQTSRKVHMQLGFG